MSRRSEAMVMACMIASGSLPPPSRWLAKDSGARRALVRSRVNVVAMPRTSSAPGGGLRRSPRTARPSGGSIRCLQPIVQILDDSVDLIPAVRQAAGARRTGPARQEPVVGEPGLAALLHAFPAGYQSAQRLVIGEIVDLKAADPVEPRGEKRAGSWPHLGIHSQDVPPECTAIPYGQRVALAMAFLDPFLETVAGGRPDRPMEHRSLPADGCRRRRDDAAGIPPYRRACAPAASRPLPCSARNRSPDAGESLPGSTAASGTKR